jgi:AcrR family transcriptional regulator
MSRPRSISDETLLATCRATFLEEGLGVSTKHLAARAGVSEGLLFQRFSTKDDLFFACMRLPPPVVDLALQAALAEANFQQALRHLAVAALDYLRTQMPMVLLALAHPASRSSRGSRARELIGNSQGLHDAFARLFETHRQSDRVAGRDHGAIITVLISTLLTRAIHEQIGLDDPGDTAAWLDRMISALGEGLGIHGE